MLIEITCGSCRRSFVVGREIFGGKGGGQPLKCPQCGKQLPEDMQAIIEECLEIEPAAAGAGREPFEVMIQLKS